MFRDYIVKILGNSPANTPLKEVYGDLQEEVNDLYKEDYKYHCTKLLFVDVEPLMMENYYLDINNNIYKIISVEKYREHMEIYLFLCNFINVKVNGIDKKVLIAETTQQLDYLDEKLIISDFLISTGSIIEYQGYKWFVTSQVSKDSDMYRCRITKIEDKIKVYIKDILYEIPCIITVNSIGTKENQWMSVVDGNIVVTIQDNEITQKLEINNKFIKFKSKWEIIGFSMEQKGLIHVYTKKTQIGSEDDMVNEIADRWETETKHEYSIEVENVLNLKLGDTKQLAPTIKDSSNVVSLPLIYSSSDNTIATIDQNGLITCLKDGNCNIKVALKDYESISQTIALSVKSVVTISYDFSPANYVVAFGMQKSYSCFKMVDSVKQADTFTFKLNLNGNKPEICQFTVIDGNKFTIDAKKNIRISGVVIVEVLDINNVVVTTKDFKIRNV